MTSRDDDQAAEPTYTFTNRATGVEYSGLPAREAVELWSADRDYTLTAGTQIEIEAGDGDYIASGNDYASIAADLVEPKYGLKLDDTPRDPATTLPAAYKVAEHEYLTAMVSYANDPDQGGMGDVIAQARLDVMAAALERRGLAPVLSPEAVVFAELRDRQADESVAHGAAGEALTERHNSGVVAFGRQNGFDPSPPDYTPPDNGGQPNPLSPVPDFKRDAEDAARSFGFGAPATLVYTQSEEPTMSSANPTTTETEVVTAAALRIEVRPVLYPTPEGTVMGLEQAHADRTVATDYEAGPTRPGDPASRIPVEMDAEPEDKSTTITPPEPGDAPKIATLAPTVFDEADRDHIQPGGNDYAALRAETPTLAQQVEALELEEARHGISQQDADTLSALRVSLADQQPAAAMNQDAPAPALQPDEGPTSDELWSKAADEAVQAQSAREQSAERPEGDNIRSNGEAPARSILADMQAELDAMKAEDAPESDKERDAGPEGAAAAFRSFGR